MPSGEETEVDFLREFLHYLKTRKRFWLLPLMIIMGLFGGLIILTEGSSVAPFIYALF